MEDLNMFDDRAKGVNRKVKIERFKRKKVYLIFGTKLQKVVGNKSMQRGKMGLGKEKGLFSSGKKG